MAITKEDVVEFIENMTVIELSNFVKGVRRKNLVCLQLQLFKLPLRK